MTARGPWYITARAVRDYAALASLGDADDDDVFAQAEESLIELAAATVASGRKPARLASGALSYRGPSPLRLRLHVVERPRPEGPLPQLVRVLPASEAQRGRQTR